MRPAIAVAACAAALACATPLPAPAPVMPAALVPIDAAHNKARDFARVFCSALTHLRDEAGRSWGDCDRYLVATVPPAPEPPLTSSPYRFLLVPDFGAGCLKDVRAFSTSIAHLHEAHGIDIESFPVPPFGPSGENGQAIARHLEEGWAADATRRYVLVGYGKGAADLLDALRALDQPETMVAALVTIAGDVGGTWIPDDVAALMTASQPWIAPGCPANVQDGVFSLRRDVRQRFLRESSISVPGYSLAASSTLDETATALRPSWRRLALYTAEQDGQYAAWETILPGAKYLGTARADHWAVALPFGAEPKIKGIDHNRFPRDAVLEAIVRFVASDLAAASSQP